MYLRGFQADAERGEHEYRDEQDLACVALEEAAEDEQLLLQPGADPQRRAPAFDVTLQCKTHCIKITLKLHQRFFFGKHKSVAVARID